MLILSNVRIPNFRFYRSQNIRHPRLLFLSTGTFAISASNLRFCKKEAVRVLGSRHVHSSSCSIIYKTQQSLSDPPRRSAPRRSWGTSAPPYPARGAGFRFSFRYRHFLNNRYGFHVHHTAFMSRHSESLAPKSVEAEVFRNFRAAWDDRSRRNGQRAA